MKLRLIQALALLCLSAGLAFGQSLTLSTGPNPSTVGQSVTLTANPNDVTVSGTTVAGSPTITVNSSAGLAVGMYLAGTNTVITNITQNRVTLSTSASSTGSGNFTFTFLPPNTTITFYDNGSSSGPVIGSTTSSPSGGPVNTQVSNLGAGVHRIISCYQVFQPQTCSNVVSQTVNSPVQNLTLTSSLNPSNVGQSVTLTANPVPSFQTATFFDGGVNGTVLGSGSNNGNGPGPVSITASFSTTGNHPLIACYGSDPQVCSNTVSQTVNQQNVPTSLSFTSSPNPSSPCQPVTLTATVLTTSGAPATGSVNFFDGTTTLASNVPLTSNGSASFTVSSFSLGTHLLQARYNPDPGFGGSSGSLSQTVSGGSATATLSSAPNPSNFNQNVVITVTVSAVPCQGSTPPTPTGSVTFFDGTTQIGQSNLANGTATFSTSTLAVGPHGLDARYNGDQNYAAVNSNTVTQTVNQGKANTTTTLTAAPNPAIAGQAVTLTASVTPAGATGQVQFLDGGNVIGTSTLSGGTASFSNSNFTQGTHSLTAVYLGDANFNTSTSNAVTETINPPPAANTTTTLNVSPNPANAGQPVTLSVSVTPVSGSGTPTGQVQFRDGGSVIGTSTLNGGAASFSNSNFTQGTHSLTAVYLGDANFNTSTSNTVALTVVPFKQNTTTSLSASPNPVSGGQPLTLTASVTPVNATGIPTGTMQFFDGSSPLGGPVTLSNGTASFTISTLSVGSHNLLATYSGDANFNSSTGTVSVIVSPPPKQNTTTSLTATPNPVTSGQPLTLTAMVSASGATGIPTGTVQFFDGSTSLGTFPLGNGVASTTTSTMSLGTHNLSASYSGDGNFNPSTGTFTVNVIPPTNQPTSISLSVAPLSANPGQAVSMSAMVTPAAATGTVTFTDNGSTLANVTLNNGTAVFQTTTLPVGSHTIVAVYNPSNNSPFNSSSSNAMTVVINGPSTQTTLNVNPTTSTFGQTVVLTASVAPVNATGTPTGTITFSEGATTLGTATLNGGSATFSISTLSVGTHSLVAAYSGDSTFGSSSSLPVTEQVNKATTTTALTAVPTTANSGQAVVLTAKVTPATATGTITFMDGTTAIGAPVPIVAGSASTSTSTLTNGSHSITAVYSGDGNFLTSTSAPPVIVTVGVLTPTTTTLAVTPASPALGQAVTLTATVAPAGATGTVRFLDGPTTLATQPLTNGTATFTTSSLSTGAHSLTAVYSGDTRFATSTSNAVTTTLPKADSTTTLTATPNPVLAGQTVTLRATVTPATATGTVTFREGATTLGSGTLSNGVASFTTSTLTTGSHTLTASYAGDANFNPSSSATVTEVVNPTGTPLGNISPTTLPIAIVGVPYSVTFTVTGGTLPLTWSMPSGSVPGLILSPAGVLSGMPTTAGTTTLGVRVTDNAGSVTATAPTLTVLPLPGVTISVTQPTLFTDQPAPTVTLGQAFPTALIATFTLTFTPNANNLPTPFSYTAVQFAGGGTTSPNITIPPNSTAPITLPGVQLGSVAGTIAVRLATLTSNGQSVLPTNPPTTNITVPRLAPVITAGSVRIVNITSTAFSVILQATCTPRDLTSASLTFSPASGAQLNGAQETVQLTTPATTWFTSAAGGTAGGAFTLTMPFTYSGDPAAIGTVSVTLTDSAGTSPAVAGGR